jgi:hypothetical protein
VIGLVRAVVRLASSCSKNYVNFLNTEIVCHKLRQFRPTRPITAATDERLKLASLSTRNVAEDTGTSGCGGFHGTSFQPAHTGGAYATLVVPPGDPLGSHCDLREIGLVLAD